ncbi:MAG: hypothetical protein ACD_75C00476G0006 [uncultured bacterium]|nr:MAG: hypothetical protein ACD_75C00476G0006 [uncultured bacterium]
MRNEKRKRMAHKRGNGNSILNKRGCGILLHPTSLPGPGGIGTLGEDARRYIDLLQNMGISYWQVLPLTPPACGNSPYSAFTAFGGNPLLIDLERIVGEGDLPDALSVGRYPADRVDFAAVTAAKMERLYQAGSAFLARGGKKISRAGIRPFLQLDPPGCMTLPFSCC